MTSPPPPSSATPPGPLGSAPGSPLPLSSAGAAAASPAPPPTSRSHSAEGPAHANAAAESLELFRRSWQSYRLVLDHDLMEHRSLSAALAPQLREACERLRQQQPQQPLDLIDLGCGDLGLLAEVYRGLPLDRFVGLDASPPVLPLAQQALGAVPFSCEWHCDDLSRWLLDPSSPQLAIVVSCFALHHLDQAGKRRALEALRQRLRPGGVVLLADTVRHDGDSHDEHMRRNLGRVRRWAAVMGAEASQAIHDHVAFCDRPADLGELIAQAREAGWRPTLLWSDNDQLEGLLRLDPT
ncbi:MAG: class I SAM-dependent methyltransferase [Synechococcaceae cyanobacterium]